MINNFAEIVPSLLTADHTFIIVIEFVAVGTCVDDDDLIQLKIGSKFNLNKFI